MEMLNCQNCGKRTGHKRTLGFGTFFAVVITFGLWILAIPFYPKRCIICGELKSVNSWNSLTPTQKKTWGIVALVAIFAVILSHLMPSTNDSSVPRDTNSSTNPAEVTVPTSESHPIDLSDIHIQALDYVNDYKNNRKKYEEHTVLITGKISGIFIPPPSVRFDMTKKGLSANAFIYFSDKPVSDATQTLMDDGVSCYIDESLEVKASQLHIGQTITLHCKHAAIQTLSECTLADEIPSTTSETPPEHTDRENYSQEGNTVAQ